MPLIKIKKESRIDYYWDIYISDCRLRGLVHQTIKNKESYFTVFYNFLGDNLKLENITQSVLDEFVKYRLSQGIKNVSVNCSSRVINAFFNWLYENNYTNKRLKIKMLKEQEVVKDTYNNEELKKLLEKPNLKTDDFADYRTWVIINYILGTGNRIGSIMSIQNKDVDLENGCINLQHTKNKKGQIVVLPTTLCTVLNEYMKIREGEREDYLFCNCYGEQITKGGLNNALIRYCKKRGVQSLGHHAFRHTFAKISVRDCHIDAFRLQKVLGHSNIKTTTHYVRLFSDDLKNGLDDYNALEYVLRQNHPKQKMNLRGGMN